MKHATLIASLILGVGAPAGVALVAVTGCDTLKADVPGDVTSLEAVILGDLGKPLDVILLDVGKTVAGDALQILYDFVKSLLDSQSITAAQRTALEGLLNESHAKLAARR